MKRCLRVGVDVCAAGGHVDTHGSASHAPVPARDSGCSGHDSCCARARPHFHIMGSFWFSNPFIVEAGETVAFSCPKRTVQIVFSL